MFSLCIPTIDRFDSFLDKYLEKYLENDLIDEIIITDENGNDYFKIINKYPSIKVYKNDSILGPFLNKLKVMSLASNEWVVLMDSDNFADYDYFKTAKEYILENNLPKNTILSPCMANPNFNFSRDSGKIFKKEDYISDGVLINAGNYIVNKYLVDSIDISKETENIKKSSACDVIFFNTLLFEQLDLHFHVVKSMEYLHVVHNGSIYNTTCSNHSSFNKEVYSRYKKCYDKNNTSTTQC